MICTFRSRRMAIWRNGLLKASYFGMRYLHVRLGSLCLTIGPSGRISLRKWSQACRPKATSFLLFLVELRGGILNTWIPYVMISSRRGIPPPAAIWRAKAHSLGLASSQPSTLDYLRGGFCLLTGNLMRFNQPSSKLQWSTRRLGKQ